MTDATDPIGTAAEIGRVAFLSGQHPELHRADRALLLSMLPLFYVGGRRSAARLAPEYMRRSGWVSDVSLVTRSLPRLEAIGVVRRVGREEDRLWSLSPPERWRWPDGGWSRASHVWTRAVETEGWRQAEAMDLLRRIVERLPPHAFVGSRRKRPTFHPDDRSSLEWHDLLDELAVEYGAPAVVGALRELQRDPESLPAWTPKMLKASLWAFALRARRNDP